MKKRKKKTRQELIRYLEEFREERRYKNLVENVLPERERKLLRECYAMIDKIQENPELKKVYWDVDFYGMILDLEVYNSDLLRAQELFPAN